jgi:hypothetical protein
MLRHPANVIPSFNPPERTRHRKVQYAQLLVVVAFTTWFQLDLERRSRGERRNYERNEYIFCILCHSDPARKNQSREEDRDTQEIVSVNQKKSASFRKKDKGYINSTIHA